MVTVNQKDIPEYDMYDRSIIPENIENGWKEMVFERIAKYMGYAIIKEAHWLIMFNGKINIETHKQIINKKFSFFSFIASIK